LNAIDIFGPASPSWSGINRKRKVPDNGKEGIVAYIFDGFNRIYSGVSSITMSDFEFNEDSISSSQNSGKQHEPRNSSEVENRMVVTVDTYEHYDLPLAGEEEEQEQEQEQDWKFGQGHLGERVGAANGGRGQFLYRYQYAAAGLGHVESSDNTEEVVSSTFTDAAMKSPWGSKSDLNFHSSSRLLKSESDNLELPDQATGTNAVELLSGLDGRQGQISPSPSQFCLGSSAFTPYRKCQGAPSSSRPAAPMAK
jgi:hypothetical protein